MDHSHMDHGHMDHDMPGMDHGHKCNMNVRSPHKVLRGRECALAGLTAV